MSNVWVYWKPSEVTRTPWVLRICLSVVFICLASSCVSKPDTPSSTRPDQPQVLQDQSQFSWHDHLGGWQKQKYIKGYQHKALASGSNNVVAASSNETSIERAIYAALRDCVIFNGTYCQIAEVNGITYREGIHQESNSEDIVRIRMNQFFDGRNNKALAISRNSAIGVAESFSLAKEAIAEAIRACNQAGGIECRVVMLNNRPYYSSKIDSQSASVVSSAEQNIKRTFVLEGKTYSENEYGDFTTWKCMDYYYPASVLVEVGIFSDPNLSEKGFVLYEGGDVGDLTYYHRKGLKRRWDWGPNYNYSFTVGPDGVGLYYDFSILPDGEKSKESDNIYKCIKQ